MPKTGEVIDVNVQAKPKVLVADDEQDIASLIEDWLSETYDVTIALNGKTAVQKAIWHQPNVILLDIVMPDMGGYEVVRLLQSTPQTQDIPLIVMTAKNYDDSTVKMIKAEKNVYGFINKPFKPTDLLKMIQRVSVKDRTFEPTTSSAPIAPGGPPMAPPSAGPAARPQGVPSAPAPFRPRNPTPDSSLAQRAVDRSVGPIEFKKPTPEPRAPAGNRAGALPVAPAGGGSLYGGRPRTRMESLSRGASRLFFLAAFLLGGVVSVGEWTARNMEQQVGHGLFVPSIYPANRFNAFLPYQWLSSTTDKKRVWKNGGVVYEFNQWGLRGEDFPLVGPEGRTRVLLVGGSFVFGRGISTRDLLSNKLQETLDKITPGTYQVINAGLWQTSPEEQWAYIKEVGFNFKPAVVFWLIERREPGTPTSEGLKWLAEHRWMVEGFWGKSRLLKLWVAHKITGSGDPVLTASTPLLREALEGTRSQRVKLVYWFVSRDSAGNTAGRTIPVPPNADPEAYAELMDRLNRALAAETLAQTSGQN
ncbi:MAG: response regulator [Elusimicrobia bacterium]|jgi:CheY-like chemotaxis protein|nr:response regulator [Elusimicrobiota bacterium]MBK7208199.1 response regulator [Elusimicrobiota bacterium]MBK7544963.1 response regulator [Elusimicrobiota bacterium]MBK7574480.1 response regulator [Elusimicrobiota bacterium]MBK7688156.1 response regulator [Elusimicrobiota bacterium]